MTDESAGEFDRAEVERAIASCRQSHEALVEHLRSLDAVEPATPTDLPDWSVGHLLTHLARNADSQLDMLAGRRQYPSVESRNADIEGGAGRSWAELVADVASTCDQVDAAFADHPDWSGSVEMMAGVRPARFLPLARQREVEVHRVDLAFGYTFADLPADYLRRDLRMLGMWWMARRPMGLTKLPAAALALTPSDRLAWLMGRREIEGLEPADLF